MSNTTNNNIMEAIAKVEAAIAWARSENLVTFPNRDHAASFNRDTLHTTGAPAYGIAQL